jgi:hypothetical protein
MKVWFYKLTDAQGNSKMTCAADCADNITIGGYDASNKYQQYDSYEAYYAYEWAKKHGFKLEWQTVEIDPWGQSQ